MRPAVRPIVMRALSLTFILVPIFLLYFWAHAAISRTTLTAAVYPSIHCAGERAGEFACHKTHFDTLAEVFGERVALDDLKHLYARDPFVVSQCHQLAHGIGNVAARSYADIADAFVNGDAICWSGYYHGVVEEFVHERGKDTFTNNADRMCANIKDKERYSFDYYNCVHGLGHGVMAVTKNELFESLALCDNLTGDWEKRSCYGGVFMENVMVDNRNHYAAYLKPDDLLYPCNAVGHAYKEECYKMQTSYALTKNGRDFNGLFELCAGADPDFRNTCAQSIGRDASGSSVSDVEKTKTTCALADTDDQHANCIIGGVKDFVSYFHSDIQAREFCFAIPSRFQSTCETALMEQWRTL